MKKFSEKSWVVKRERPDDYLRSPFEYYTDEEVERYVRSGGMRRAQEKIAYRVLELLNSEKGSSLLDLGSGPGCTAEVYRENGYAVVCLDLIPKMVEKSLEKGFESYVGDMRELKEIFPEKKFDGVVSVSALQWVKNKKEIERIADGISFVLKGDGVAVIQFYPRSEKELNGVAKIFCKRGFETKAVTDWPDVPKNRTFYLVLTKR